MIPMNRVFRKLLLVLVIFFFFLSGCAHTGNYGTFRRDRELNQMFLSYQVIPDYNYFTTGGYDRPKAILGVHKDYLMVTDFWVSIPDVDSAQMYKWIRTIDPEDRGPEHNYFASYILDQEGKQVGIWYSNENSTVVKFLEDNKIDVYPPDPVEHRDLFNGKGGGMGIRP
jgi:hypothetical protein